MPLFYLTRDVRLGQPKIDCVTATIDAVTDNQNASIVFLITGLVMLLSVSGAFILCNRTDPEPIDLENLKDFDEIKD